MAVDQNKQHFADKYFEEIDVISESINYFEPVLSDVAHEIEFKTAHVLDVGCGTGVFLEPLVAAGCTELYGVDGPNRLCRPGNSSWLQGGAVLG